MKIYLKKFVSSQVTLIFALACFTLAPQARAACQHGCDTGNGSTFLGFDALSNNTTGFGNTAVGAEALLLNSVGVGNTATGAFALLNNDGGGNSAFGNSALYTNADGFDNSAFGIAALSSNFDGSGNTAMGAGSLAQNQHAIENTAVGDYALNLNDNTGTGLAVNNCALGSYAMSSNIDGADDCAFGYSALTVNDTGSRNTAVGSSALWQNTSGSSNIALGDGAGQNLTTGDNNIDIGNDGVADEANTIRIGTQGTQTKTFIAGISGASGTGTPVVINSNGRLGVRSSSQRFKEAIKPMDKASEAILALKPVTFRYKHEIDPKGTPEFGLVAEEVEKVNPDLVARDEQGKPYTVRYEAVNAMLLNEFLKAHRTVQEQEATIVQLKSGVAKQETLATRQQKQIEALTAGLQKVSAQLEVSKPAPKTASTNH